MNKKYSAQLFKLNHAPYVIMSCKCYFLFVFVYSPLTILGRRLHRSVREDDDSISDYVFVLDMLCKKILDDPCGSYRLINVLWLSNQAAWKIR